MERYFKEAIGVFEACLGDARLLGTLRESAELVAARLGQGNKILIAGNGGSAADAQHFSAELVGRYMLERKAFPAMALTVDSSILTAWSNDYSYDTVFARQLEAHGRAGDVFVAITTSGNSRNLVEAATKAKALGMDVIGLLGKGGGALKDLCDKALIVPSDSIPRIQEVHGLLIHAICEDVERALA